MPPIKAKPKFQPQSMTITKCFERQREKLQARLSQSPNSPDAAAAARKVGDVVKTPDISRLHLRTPSSTQFKANQDEPRQVKSTPTSSTAGNAQAMSEKRSMIKTPLSSQSRRGDLAARPQSPANDNRPNGSIPSPHVPKRDIILSAQATPPVLVKSARRNLITRMNECSPASEQDLQDISIIYPASAPSMSRQPAPKKPRFSLQLSKKSSLPASSIYPKENDPDSGDDFETVMPSRRTKSTTPKTPLAIKSSKAIAVETVEYDSMDEFDISSFPPTPISTPKFRSPAKCQNDVGQGQCKLASPMDVSMTPKGKRPSSSASSTVTKSSKIEVIELSPESKIKSKGEIQLLSPSRSRLPTPSTPTQQRSSSSATFVVTPRKKNYLNMLPDRFDDLKSLMRSPVSTPSTSRSATPNSRIRPSPKIDGRQCQTPTSSNNSSGDKLRLDENGETFIDTLMPLEMRVASNDGQDDLHYYLRNFLSVLKSVINYDEDWTLFNDYDISVVKNFYLLSCKAQKLYVRLFTRRFTWIPLAKMKYPEIDKNLEPISGELRQQGFLEYEENLTCLTTALNLLPVPSLKELSKRLGLKAIPKKPGMMESILNHCNHQKSVLHGFDVSEAVMHDAIKLLGTSCRLLETPRKIFLRILILYSLTDTTDKHEDRPFQLETLLRVNMGQLVYPVYKIFRQAIIFKSRSDLIRYETAYILDCEIGSAMEKKDWEKAESLCAIAVEHFNSLLSDKSLTTHDAKLPTFLRMFTAGHLYILCLEHRVELLQKLERYQEAVAQLENLLNQNIYCQNHKGHWIERVALNLDKHLDKPLKSLRVIAKALADPSLTDDHKLALHQRATRIANSKKRRFVSKRKLVLPGPIIRKPHEEHIQGQKMQKSIPGYKTLFMTTEFNESGSQSDISFCSVEEFAILHYRSLGFCEGIHGEGSALISLFGLLFWDIIYKDGIADAFRCNHQNFPLDLFTKDFYLNRKDEICERIDLMRTSLINELIQMMSDVWTRHKGHISIINWNLYQSFHKVQSLVCCMGTEFLAKVCLRFATNYKHYRAGIPDIIVWNPRNGSWKMVEVKGPGDHLSSKQILWLDYLLENEVAAEVCYVKAISGKEINK